MRLSRTLILAASFLLPASSALAVDGVLEIHQACVATGCFAGDAAGYPVTIANPGSYRLTSNLVLPDENTTGIEISAAYASLDLGGFEIAGITVCEVESSPFSVTCSPTSVAGGSGIRAFGVPNPDVSIHNGTIRGTGWYGIEIVRGRLRDLTVTDAGYNGIWVGSRSVLEAIVVRRAGSDGIAMNSGGLVDGCVVEQVGGDGIVGASVRNSYVHQAGADGIVAAGHLVVGNEVQSASGYGLNLGLHGGYGNNVLMDNNGGNSNSQVQGGHEIGTNVCGTDTTCP